MRLVIAVALVALAIAGVVPAHTADLGWSARYVVRAEPFVIYDFEPGIVMRAYWAAPFGNRRYFPATGTKPELGRDEDTTGDVHRPPQDYFRSWSTSFLINRALLGGTPPLERNDVPQK